MPRTKVNYRKIWEDAYKACILSGLHVHHKDGNSHNNEPDNLILVTPEEHDELHQLLGHKRLGNFIKKADNQTGIPCSLSKKENIAKALRGKPLDDTHKLKIAEAFGPIREFVVFDKFNGKELGRFKTKQECQRALGLPPNKVRLCLSKKRHSIGRHFLTYADEYSGDNVVNLYNNCIRSSLKKMGESQRKRLACLRK